MVALPAVAPKGNVVVYSAFLAAAFAGSSAFTPRAVGKPLHGRPTTVVSRVLSGGRYVLQTTKFPTQIQHVVVIYMENRTMDNLLSAYYAQPWPSGGTWGQALDLANPNDPNVPLTSQPLTFPFDPGHAHSDFVLDAAGEWDQEPLNCGNSCPAGATVFSYVPANETPNYATIITNFATASHVLQSNEGPSLESHLYSIAGQSAGIPNPRNTGAPNAEAEIPVKTNNFGNCGAPKKVPAINMLGKYPGNDGPNGPERSECADYPTILDEMASAYGNNDTSWQYVSHSDDGLWSAPMNVAHLYAAWARTKSKADQPFAVDSDAVNFAQNLYAKGSPKRPFAYLTYITPCPNESDHPQASPVADGPQWIAYILNAIGNSAYWNSTAVIITWDDWGGLYDHYQPSPWPYHPFPNPYNNADDPYEWGFRVPMLVVSPYVTSRGYVSPGLRSQGAILNFIESVFALPSLGADDASNGSDNLGDMFDLSQPPLPYVQLPTTFTPAGRCKGAKETFPGED
jgi:hypothetical protein